MLAGTLQQGGVPAKPGIYEGTTKPLWTWKQEDATYNAFLNGGNFTRNGAISTQGRSGEEDKWSRIGGAIAG